MPRRGRERAVMVSGKRQRRYAARIAREREKQARAMRWGWTAVAVWFVLMTVFTTIGPEGPAWYAVWFGGGTVTMTWAVWRTMVWWRVRRAGRANDGVLDEAKR